MMMYTNQRWFELSLNGGSFNYRKVDEEVIYEMEDVYDENGKQMYDKNGKAIQKRNALVSAPYKQMAEEFFEKEQDRIKRVAVPMDIDEEIKKYGYKSPEEQKKQIKWK